MHAAFVYLMMAFIAAGTSFDDGKTGSVLTANDCAQMEVHLQRIYLDGESSEEVRAERICPEDVAENYKGWDVVHVSATTAILRKEIDDLSPLLKTNGYFGITSDGILTIFDGNPNKEKVIQSFYQLDTKKLESRWMRQLQSGIPIRSKDRYLHVINQLQHYSLKKEGP